MSPICHHSVILWWANVLLHSSLSFLLSSQSLSTLLLKWFQPSVYPMEREFVLSHRLNATYTYFLSLYSHFPMGFWVLDHPIAYLWPQKEELMNHPAILSLVSCSWFFFFSLNIKDTRSRHLKYPRTQHNRTWLQVLQRALKPSHSWDLPQESKKHCCVQSQASQCAVLHTWLDVWPPWPLRETCVEVLCTLKKSKWKIIRYIKFLPINSHFSLPVPRGLPDCIELEIRDQTMKFKMLNFRFFFILCHLSFRQAAVLSLLRRTWRHIRESGNPEFTYPDYITPDCIITSIFFSVCASK